MPSGHIEFADWNRASGDAAAPEIQHVHHHKSRKIVLCFDGTGNKFSGTDSDSNILKIYRMLDRSESDQFTYYQPGIGTYVTSNSLSHTGHWQRVRSWYMKAKDSALGTSLDHHVMGGYKFLMRYYRPDDEVYMFGFSRGAYTARFLSEMIDHIGLLSQGNEELVRFAWKTFQKWQIRTERTEQDKEEKRLLLEYMLAFRETFSRPVKPIRFLGLFDTVNSVPRFENALMSRTKFPYTARSTARVIRHAVSIGERRAKFRQDLIGEKAKGEKQQKPHHPYRARGKSVDRSKSISAAKGSGFETADRGRRMTLQVPLKERYRDHSETSGVRARSPNFSPWSAEVGRANSSRASSEPRISVDEEEEQEQDIQEVWFSGCHADIGGGWSLDQGEEVPLSHVPLVWMCREAERAGLLFDDVKMRALHCAPEDSENEVEAGVNDARTVPQLVVSDNDNVDPLTPLSVVTNGKQRSEPVSKSTELTKKHEDDMPIFDRKLHLSATKGKVHDVLCFNNGAGAVGVIAWNFMEYLPFRRMDLQDDGSWKPITWPLPKGEVRDMPDSAVVHNSVILRMRSDASYRPGNLILGGGGRGLRVAPEEYGIGEWELLREQGDLVGEVYVRKGKPVGSRTLSGHNGISKIMSEKKSSW